MDEFVNNSNKAKELSTTPVEKKNIQKIVSGRTKKKSKLMDLIDLFIPEGIENRRDYIIKGVVIPSIKKAVFDVFENIWYPDGSPNKKKKGLSSSYISYDGYYKDNEKPSRSTERSNDSFAYNEVIVDTRGDAENVLRNMQATIDRYHFVSVADMYDMVDLSCDYTANRYGWTDISDAQPVRLRDGSFLLKMPRISPL